MKDEIGGENSSLSLHPSSFRKEPSSLRYAIDFDLLKQELSTSLVEGPQERYQLNWPGKREALLTANAPIAKTLRPCRAESVDFDTTQNLYIEGDNLDALKLLQETYLGKVKMIYIDPPYNTGNDFIYEDDFAENTEAYFERSNQKDEVGNRMIANTESNGRFHSDWLSMMYPRLRLAKNLLREDGAIFISLDDTEAAAVRLVLNELFGEKMFVGVFPWRSRTAKADVPFGVSNDVEWVIVYAKPNFFAGRSGERRYFKTDDFEDRWRLSDLTTNKSKDERPNSFFTMVNPKNNDAYASGEIRTWAVTNDTFANYYKAGKIVFPGDYDFLSIKRPAYRVFEQEDKNKAFAKYGSDEVRMSVSTYLPEKDVGRTEHGSKEIRELFGSQVFSFPKPVPLIKFFIENVGDSEAIYLDFFAGSGTTSQAIMELNAQDGGNRRYILVQIPEILNPTNKVQKTACDFCDQIKKPRSISEITKERIRRAGKKIKNENADKEGIENLDIGFRVLKVDSSNMKDVYYTPDKLMQVDLEQFTDNIRDDSTPEDLLFQVLLDWGVDLTLPITMERMSGKDEGGRMKDGQKDEGGRMKDGQKDEGGRMKDEKGGENSSSSLHPSSFKVFFVDDNALAACFDADITEAFVKELAARHPMRVVFRDAGFASDSVKINIEQIFKLISPATEIKTL